MSSRIVAINRSKTRFVTALPLYFDTGGRGPKICTPGWASLSLFLLEQYSVSQYSVSQYSV